MDWNVIHDGRWHLPFNASCAAMGQSIIQEAPAVAGLFYGWVGAAVVGHQTR
jgi:hypothetical protein